MYYNILCIVFTWQSRQGDSCMALCGARADDIPPSKARFFLAVKKWLLSSTGGRALRCRRADPDGQPSPLRTRPQPQLPSSFHYRKERNTYVTSVHRSIGKAH